MGVFVGGGLVWLGFMAGWCELRLDVGVAGSCWLGCIVVRWGLVR